MVDSFKLRLSQSIQNSPTPNQFRIPLLRLHFSCGEVPLPQSSEKRLQDASFYLLLPGLHDCPSVMSAEALGFPLFPSYCSPLHTLQPRGCDSVYIAMIVNELEKRVEVQSDSWGDCIVWLSEVLSAPWGSETMHLKWGQSVPLGTGWQQTRSEMQSQSQW